MNKELEKALITIASYAPEDKEYNNNVKIILKFIRDIQVSDWINGELVNKLLKMKGVI